MDIKELAAREEIRELVASYNHFGDTGIMDSLLELFADDAAIHVADRTITGQAELRKFFSSVAGPDSGRPKIKSLQHHTSLLSIEVLDAKHARGRCYFSVFTALGLDHWGRYRDEYVCVDGVWKFSLRNAKVAGRQGTWGKTPDTKGD